MQSSSEQQANNFLLILQTIFVCTRTGNQFPGDRFQAINSTGVLVSSWKTFSGDRGILYDPFFVANLLSDGLKRIVNKKRESKERSFNTIQNSFLGIFLCNFPSYEELAISFLFSFLF